MAAATRTASRARRSRSSAGSRRSATCSTPSSRSGRTSGRGRWPTRWRRSKTRAGRPSARRSAGGSSTSRCRRGGGRPSTSWSRRWLGSRAPGSRQSSCSIRSPAMPWTAEDIPDLSGRRAVVTGANSGLGLQIALGLARHGVQVTLAVRDTSKGEEAASRIRDEAPGAALDIARLDLADLSSVREFARDWEGGLDLLVNNAGVMALPRRTTVDGFEMQLGTNHLGHFALTGLVLPSLLERPGARVVTMSSGAHQMGGIRFDNLQGERHYQRWLAYAQSKLANLLFAFELARRAAL